MGTINHRLMPLQTDNPSTRSQQYNNSSTSEPISGFNPAKESLLQLTVSDPNEHDQIMENIGRYSSPEASPSISQLKEYYKVKKEGYCTSQFVFYLVFNGCGCCGLKDQFGVRKMNANKFDDLDIIAVLKTYITGLKLYLKEFKRKIDKIDLDDIGFQILSPRQNHTDRDNSFHSQKIRPVRMYFIDPWLKQRRQQQIISVNQVNVLLQNPSPQRLESSYHVYSQFNPKNHNGQNYPNGQNSPPKTNKQNDGHTKKLQSLLFSIGVIGLKMLEMGFVDDIYVKMPVKKVNFQKIQQYIEKHNNSTTRSNISPGQNGSPHQMYTTTAASMTRQKLIAGLKILLLSETPKEREKIFDFWKISLNEINVLNGISLENGLHLQSESPSSTQQQMQTYSAQTAQGRLMSQGHRQTNYSVRNDNHISAHNEKIGPSVNDKNGHSELSQRHKLYSIDDRLMAPDKKPDISYNKNDLTNRTHQYVYKVDQFKHQHNQITNPVIIPQNQTYQQPYYASQSQQFSNYHQNGMYLSTQMYPGQSHGYKNQKNLQQLGPLIIGLNHQVKPPSLISQNAYFNRLEYKMPQKSSI